MTNTQSYCDHCGRRTTFMDKMSISNGRLGVLALDLCRECGDELWERYNTIRDARQKVTREPFEWWQKAITPWADQGKNK